ncbi:hypothetical protein JK358_26390 [Nocardia sp. 2]|uniref:Resolvase/invertase-type recombinase catalytic domain-containing protein n=2 Tax=Nocardia acididurans TaxID=2802282 RepID=A0ABS1MBK9_9NOCA|nr:hypothetical protein [Nocardia acididurans]
MRFRPTALGYVRSDVAGIQQARDEAEIRRVAQRLGYDLAKIVVFQSGDGYPLRRLKRLISDLGAEAVIVPNVKHFDAEKVPTELVRRVDVITVRPESTHARWSTGFVDNAG